MSSDILKNNFTPHTEMGKELLELLNEQCEDMKGIFEKCRAYLINRTLSVDRFANKLTSVKLLSDKEKEKIMRTRQNSTRLDQIYKRVQEHNNWGKLIYSWEEHNHHIIQMLLKCIQNEDVTNSQPLLQDEDDKKAEVANKLMRSYTRRMDIFLLCFFLTVVVIPVIFYVSVGTKTKQSIIKPKVPHLYPPTAELPLMLEVNSAVDLNNLEGIETIVVFNLEDAFSPTTKHLRLQNSLQYNSIKNLTIAGRVSIDWLKYMIGTFKNLKHFSLDMSQVCLGVALDSPSTYTPLKLENCETFQVLNSKTCYLESWVYRWEFPMLRNLTFVRVDVNKRNCNRFNYLVNEHAISSVKFEDCNVFNCRVIQGTETLIKP